MPAYVQGDWNNGAASSTTMVISPGGGTMTITAGNAIVVAVRWLGAAITATLADNLGNTYGSNIVSTPNGDSHVLAVWVAQNVTGGGGFTLTATFSSATTDRAIAFHEVSGCATTSVVNGLAIQAQDAPGTGANALTSGAGTTTVANCYIFGALAESGAQIDEADAVAGTSFTSRQPFEGTSGFNPVIGTEDRILSTAGSVAATWTHATASAGRWMTAMVALAPAAAQARRTIYQMRRRH